MTINFDNIHFNGKIPSPQTGDTFMLEDDYYILVKEYGSDEAYKMVCLKTGNYLTDFFFYNKSTMLKQLNKDGFIPINLKATPIIKG